MASRIFGIKASGYLFIMGDADNEKEEDLTRVKARELKDGSWTFFNHEYKDINELDSCMAFAIMFLIDKGVTSFSTVGIKSNMPIVEYIFRFNDKRTSKRITMRANAHSLIRNSTSREFTKLKLDSEREKFEPIVSTSARDYIINFRYDSATTTEEVMDNVLRNNLFRPGVEETETETEDDQGLPI